MQIALLLTNFVTGAMLEKASNPAAAVATDGASATEHAAITETWTGLFADGRYPNLARAAQSLRHPVPFDPDSHFEFGLSILMSGLEQRRAQPQPPS